MTTRSRKIFICLLLVVVCIASVAMPFAYATVTPTDEVTNYYYPVLPFDTLRIDYESGQTALYPLPTRFSFPSTTDTYVMELSPDNDLNPLYHVYLELSARSVPNYVSFGSYEDVLYFFFTVRVSGFANDEEVVSPTNCRFSFLMPQFSFVDYPFYYRNHKLTTLMPPTSSNDASSFSVAYTNYEIDFYYHVFDRQTNSLVSRQTEGVSVDHFQVPVINYPALSGEPDIWSYRFGVNPGTVSSDIDFTHGCLVQGSISATSNNGYFGFRSLLVGDLDYPKSGVAYINKWLIPDFPDSLNFTAWISTAISSVMEFELIPGMSLWSIFVIVVAIPLVIMFLKLFAGG